MNDVYRCGRLNSNTSVYKNLETAQRSRQFEEFCIRNFRRKSSNKQQFRMECTLAGRENESLSNENQLNKTMNHVNGNQIGVHIVM